MGTSLDREPYVSLVTYKRDGTGVETAVWAAPLDGKLVVFTLRDSFKVKRLRRNPKVRVARCNLTGKVLGPWEDGTGVVVDDPAYEKRAYEALDAKYGWQMRIGTFFRRIFGGLEKRVILAITLDG
ncbi:MAG: PPOX class F420-dependent oxidoreductase [Deltaproteobacteria bacterium]|nr:PPOX class F420-dependent oxidoreductase [Deltaproteobacteria bacterium]